MNQFTPVRVEYTGDAPDASETVTLLDTTQIFFRPAGFTGKGPVATYGFCALQLTVTGSDNADNSLVLQESTDSGTNWTTVESQAADVSTGTTATVRFAFNIEGFSDFRLRWVNGAVAQSPFRVTLTLSYDKAEITSPDEI